jgi:hypothetical protein
MERKNFGDRSDRPKRSNSSRPNSDRNSKPNSSGRPSSRPSRKPSDSSRPLRDSKFKPRRSRTEGEKEASNKRFSSSGERPQRDGFRPDSRTGSRTGSRSNTEFKPRNERRGDRSLVNRRKDERRPVNKDFTKDPIIPEEITGEELDKVTRGDLLTLSAENAKVVSRHLSCVNLYADTEPDLAFAHAEAAVRHAGRVAIVRETAGYAAYRIGKFEIAIKELKAAFRISGDVSIWPVLADCERGLGRPRKALELAGSPEAKRLEKEQAIELRIVAAGARRDLGELDAAIVTLQTKDLNVDNDTWAIRLRYAFADALDAAGRKDEARKWFKKCAEVDLAEVTDAKERCA